MYIIMFSMEYLLAGFTVIEIKINEVSLNINPYGEQFSAEKITNKLII